MAAFVIAGARRGIDLALARQVAARGVRSSQRRMGPPPMWQSCASTRLVRPDDRWHGDIAPETRAKGLLAHR